MAPGQKAEPGGEAGDCGFAHEFIVGRIFWISGPEANGLFEGAVELSMV
jgi:hypothetical protein